MTILIAHLWAIFGFGVVAGLTVGLRARAVTQKKLRGFIGEMIASHHETVLRIQAELTAARDAHGRFVKREAHRG